MGKGDRCQGDGISVGHEIVKGAGFFPIWTISDRFVTLYEIASIPDILCVILA